MDKGKPLDPSPVNLYKELLSQLLAVKDNVLSHDYVFRSCSNIHVHICEVLKEVKSSFSKPEYAFSSSGNCSTVISSLTIVKMFMEICLLAPDTEFVKMSWAKVMESGVDIQFLYLMPSRHPPTVRFLTTEIIALFVFVSQRFDTTKNYFEDISQRLIKDCAKSMLLLYTVDHLCVLSKEHEYQYFDDFLSGKNGILKQENFTRNIVSSDVDVQIITLRIYLKTLSVIHHGKSRKCIYENIDCLLVFIKTSGKYFNAVEKLFWKFLYFLLPFPGEEINEKKQIMATAEKILISFTSRLGMMKRTNENGEYDVIYAMAMNTALKSMLWVSKDLEAYSSSFEHAMLRFSEICASFRNSPPACAIDIISCLIEEDEDLIDFLVLHLEMHCVFLKTGSFPDGDVLSISPLDLFLELVMNLSFDFSIFNDWLVSNETRFLRYFVRFLKLVRLDWSQFIKACKSSDLSPRFQKSLSNITSNGVLDACVSTFIKLKNSIKKLHRANLFPYSPDPLLKHLTAIEELFEGSEDPSSSVCFQ